MRPLTVITGILLGSCLAITVSLAAVLVVFVILGDDYPRVQHEFDSLVASVSIFLVMTTISAGSFYALLINHAARYWAQGLMWAGLAATTWYYLP
jgi:TctA family transporter